MATFIPAPDCVLVEILGQQNGQHCEMTIGAQKSGGYILSDLVALAGAVDGWVNTDLLPWIGSDAQYLGVDIRGLESEADLEYNLSEPLDGTSPDLALPANVAVCVTKQTGATGRSQRGRMYVWGVPSGAALDTRHLLDSAVDAYSGIFDNLLVAIVSAGFTGVVISYYHDSAPRVTAQVRAITNIFVRDNRLDTQRRRLGRS